MPNPSEVDDLFLSIVKARINGNFPSVVPEELEVLKQEASRLLAEDVVLRRSVHPDTLDVGEDTMRRREVVSSSISAATQSLRLTYFTSSKSETISQVSVITSGTAAAATPTLIRLGIYKIETNGDHTLVASTANDTTLFAAVTTLYTKSLQVPFEKVAGQRYAFGILIVTAVATPTFYGNSIGGGASFLEPKLSSTLNGQSDLPSTIASGSVGTLTSSFYASILP